MLTIGTLAPYSRLSVADALGGLADALRRVMLAAEPAQKAQILDAISRAEARFALSADAPMEVLVQALREHTNSHVRELTIELVGHRGNEARPFLRELGQALEQSHPKVLRSFGDAVSAAGRAASTSSWASHDEAVHAAAATAMVRIAPADPLVVPAHAYRLLHAAEVELRLESARALGARGAEAERAVPSLVAALADTNVLVLREVITALGLIGPAATDALPVLEPLAEDNDQQTRARAQAALRQIREQ